MRTALDTCIKLFRDKNTNDTQIRAAKKTVGLIEEIFVIYMSIGHDLQRPKKSLFLEHTRIQYGCEIPLIEKGVSVIQGL